MSSCDHELLFNIQFVGNGSVKILPKTFVIFNSNSHRVRRDDALLLLDDDGDDDDYVKTGRDAGGGHFAGAVGHSFRQISGIRPYFYFFYYCYCYYFFHFCTLPERYRSGECSAVHASTARRAATDRLIGLE